jgi:hypothetical protein
MTNTSTSLMCRGGGLSAPQLDYILVDGSGSMMSKWWETLAGLDSYINILKSQNISSHGIVQVFDTRDPDYIQRDCPIGEWPLFHEADLKSGFESTPLYDAINIMGRRLRDLDPARCAITIVTDGAETSSRYTTDVQARAILDWCRAKGWQVTFLGADFNNSRQAALLGADASNSIGVQKALMSEAGKALGEKRVLNARYGHDINFTADEKKDFGGYLTDGTNGK